MYYSKQYLDEIIRNKNAQEKLGQAAVWYMLNVQEDGWELLQILADEYMKEGGSQAPLYKSLRTMIQTASVLVEKDGELVKDKDAKKLTVGKAKDPKTGKLTEYNEIRESGTSRGKNAGAAADAEPELKLVPLMMSLVEKFGYENVQNVLRGLEPGDGELKEAA